MPETHAGIARGLFAPPVVRIGFLLWAVFSGYDTVSSQLELPTLRALLGMSGALLPWWGWLLILQAIFVYALFEYVRRTAKPLERTEAAPTSHDVKMLREEILQQAKQLVDADLRDRQSMAALARKAVEEQKKVLSIIGQRLRLSKWQDSLARMKGELEQKWEEIERLAPEAGYDMPTTYGHQPWKTPANEMDQRLSEYEKSITAELRPVDFTSAAVLDKNPESPVGNSEKVPDRAVRYDYSRLYVRRGNALREFESLIKELSRLDANLERQLSAFAEVPLLSERK